MPVLGSRCNLNKSESDWTQVLQLPCRRPGVQTCKEVVERSYRAYFLNGSFKMTFTPEIVPVTAVLTCSMASELISPAAFSAPPAAADAASLASTLTSLRRHCPMDSTQGCFCLSPATSAVPLARMLLVSLIESNAFCAARHQGHR